MKKNKSILVLLILCASNTYAQQGFNGHWSHSTESSNFNIVIEQIGDSIKGGVCAVMQNGDFIDCAMYDEDDGFISIKGTIVENVATVEFWSTYANGWGKATITKNDDNQLIWKIITEPSTGVSFIPTESNLTNQTEENGKYKIDSIERGEREASKKPQRPRPPSEIPMYSNTNGTIWPNNQFIDTSFNPQLANSQSYNAINPINVQVGSTKYTIKTAKFTDWGDADPGYNVIEISKQITGHSLSPQGAFVHRQVMGLANLFDNFYGQSLKKYSNNNFFITVPLSTTATALIFPGESYGTQASQLLIIVLTPSDVKTIFNKNMNINSITQSGYNFTMITQSNVIEGGSSETPITHTIYQQDGVLFLKND
ncbi:MAG: hypothetical protein LBU91_02165 [Bacteroidales bacterium]|nr:hypothetical protein [Bacteroidales bacterium]